MGNKRTPTEEQKKILDHSKGSLLVDANAGSGKTWVMTERVASQIARKNADIREILVITFTKDAAAKMKEDIIKKVQGRIEDLEEQGGKPEDLQYLKQQIRQTSLANIQTIDSFCLEICQQYYYLVGIDASSKMISPYQEARLSEQAMNEVLDARLDQNDIRILLEDFKTVDAICDEVRRVYTSIRTLEDPWGWLNKAVKYPVKLCDEFLAAYRSECLEFQKNINQFVERLQTLENDPSFTAKIAGKRNGIKNFEELKACCSSRQQRISQILSSQNIEAEGEIEKIDISFNKYKTIFGDEYDSLNDDFKKCKAKIRSNNEDLKQIKTEKAVLSDKEASAEAFCTLVKAFHHAYQRRKREQNLLDFADVEAYALHILQANDGLAARRYQTQFKYVYVDEYQDVNPLQDKLINLVSRPDNLFCVGDVKQSIYRFRDADPQIFIHRKQAYESDPEKGTVLHLTKNFRSDKNVLECTNDVFKKLAADSKEISYEGPDLLVGDKQDSGIRTTIVYLDQNAVPEQDKYDLRSNEVEAYWVADEIERLLKIDSETGKSRWKPSDIAVLARDRTPLQNALIPVLEQKGIPFTLDKCGFLHEQLEVQIFLSIAGLALYHQDDMGAACVFHNRFFGLSSLDLSKMRKIGNEHPKQWKKENKDTGKTEEVSINLNLYDSIAFVGSENYKEDLNLKGKAKEYLDFLAWLSKQAGTHPAREFFQLLSNKLHFMDFCEALGNGLQRRANIQALIDSCENDGADNPMMLREFLHDFKLMKSADTRIETPSLQNDDSCIKLTTIHGSKGLEYPIVFIPFIGNKGEKAMHGAVRFSTSTGMMLPYIFDKGGYIEEIDRNSMESYKSLVKEIRALEKEERMRLLYVGMTRAEQKLYLVGSEKGNTKLDAKAKDMGSESFLRWIKDMVFGKTMKIPTEFEKQWEMVEITNEYIKQCDVSSRKKSGMQAQDVQIPPELSNLAADVKVNWITGDNSLQASQIDSRKDPFEVYARFNRNKKTSLEKGTATHLIMQHADFARIQESGYVESLQDALLNEDEKKLTDAEKIRQLMNNEIGDMIMRASRIYREQKMKYLVPESLVDSEKSDKIVPFTGVMDLLFQTDGKWYLLDYKTDSFPEEDVSSKQGIRRLDEKTQDHIRQMKAYEAVLKEKQGIVLEDIFLAYTDPMIMYSIRTGNIYDKTGTAQTSGLISTNPVQVPKTVQLRLANKKLEATSRWNQEQTVLEKGSQISPTVNDSCPKNIKEARKQHAHLIDANFRLIEDISFNSPSAASCFVLGSSSSGNKVWVDENQQPLSVYLPKVQTRARRKSKNG